MKNILTTIQWEEWKGSAPDIIQHPLQLYFLAWEGEEALYEKIFHLLSDEEKQRAQTFHFEKDRQQFVFTRGVLKTLLGSVLKLENHLLSITYTEKGKPIIDDANSLNFNVSHSEKQSLIAISSTAELGVDVERMESQRSVDSITSKYFTEAEQSYIFKNDSKSKLEKFYQLWTAKESLLKAQGSGLGSSLNEVEISVSDLAEFNRVKWKDYGLLSFSLPDGLYQGALAMKGDIHTLKAVQISVADILKNY